MWAADTRNYVSALDISPDGKLLATGDYAGQVRIWNVETGEQIGEVINAGKIVFALRFDPAGQRIAIGMYGEILTKDNLLVWDLAAARPTLLPHPNAVDETAWIPGTERLMSWNANSMRLWDINQPDEPITSLDDIGNIFGSSVSGNGELIAIGTSIGSVYLIDAITEMYYPIDSVTIECLPC